MEYDKAAMASEAMLKQSQGYAGRGAIGGAPSPANAPKSPYDTMGGLVNAFDQSIASLAEAIERLKKLNVQVGGSRPEEVPSPNQISDGSLVSQLREKQALCNMAANMIHAEIQRLEESLWGR